jgi:hypothetical protein
MQRFRKPSNAAFGVICDSSLEEGTGPRYAKNTEQQKRLYSDDTILLAAHGTKLPIME